MSSEKEDLAVASVNSPPPPAPTNLRAILLAVFLAFGGLFKRIVRYNLTVSCRRSVSSYNPGLHTLMFGFLGFLFGYDIGVISVGIHVCRV